jgi:hypothetical protein
VEAGPAEQVAAHGNHGVPRRVQADVALEGAIRLPLLFAALRFAAARPTFVWNPVKKNINVYSDANPITQKYLEQICIQKIHTYIEKRSPPTPVSRYNLK